MDLTGSFTGTINQPPTTLADLAYIKTERAASHETPVLINFVKSWLHEHNYIIALACLDLLLEKKCNINDNKKPLTRHDGITPSVVHELSQALYTISLMEARYNLPDVERLLCLNFLHDLGEEFNVTQNDLRSHLRTHNVPYQEYEEALLLQFENMTKTRNDIDRYASDEAYFKTMLDRPETVIAKFQDRIHNMATLIGFKTAEKRREYILETMALRSILNQATERYPEYKRVFDVMNKIITAQIFFNSRFINKVDPGNPIVVAVGTLPRLRNILGLPPGLDPLHITQIRADEKIGWINARRDPALKPVA